MTKEINRLAFSIGKLGVRALEHLFKASVHIHGVEEIPKGVLIFVVNHFTRLETLMLGYELYILTGKPIMSLAHHSLFTGSVGAFLRRIGAVSTKDPERDKVIIRSLLVGNHPWLFFPEGAMIKDKKVVEQNKLSIYCATGNRRPPHTGAAALALHAEFYRQRLHYLEENDPELLQQQLAVFDLASMEELTDRDIFLVPVNITYYPIRSRENAIERVASYLIKDISERLREELQTEGTMLLSGVDIDICFGKPLAVKSLLRNQSFRKDIITPRLIRPNDTLPSRPLMCRVASKMTIKAMASIYHMTAVNHDHLIAYLLKYYPGQSLSLFDMAERLYLASKAVVKLKGIRFHRALHNNQRFQLCREYRQKLIEFLSVAEKSGIIEMEEDIIRKRRSKVSALFNFHTIRMENTCQVILNEVEYLRPLIRKLHLIAWYPRWFIRWRLSRQFSHANMEEFVADYQVYYRENESKLMNIGAPFFLRRFRAKTGVLLVHGYMAAPEEVRPLAEVLHRHGYSVYTPRLRGHGTSPEDLAQRSWEDWLESVERGYLALANSCEKVVLGGFSAGANLALLAAANHLFNIKAVFAINPAMRLRKTSARFAPAILLWNKLAAKLVKDESRHCFVSNEPENPHINYLRNPVSGVKELMDLIDAVSSRLYEIRLPVLIIQASDDPVVHPDGSKALYQGLGCVDKELIFFPSSRHNIINGKGSERVFNLVLKFLKSKV